jgi:zinc transport system ATP-binding protein
MKPAVRLDDVCVTRDSVCILHRVKAAFPEGKVSAIIGPNGGGKTTLLNAMLGLAPCIGRVEYLCCNGRPRIGYVPQRLDFDRQAPISVLDFLALNQQRRPLWLGIAGHARNKASAALARVQAEDLIYSPLGKLSGGELQRVQLALALMNDPDLVFLDEPISGIDMAGEKLFCDLLETIQQTSSGKRLTVVMVSHDLEVVAKHAAHVVCLKKAVLFEGPPRQVFTEDNLKRAYGLHMGMCRHILEEAPAHGVPIQINPPTMVGGPT